MMIAIIDYDAGNINSVRKAVALSGAEAILTSDANVILNADGIILPGVGSFGDAMANLNAFGLPAVINRAIAENIPFLGICLGMQLLFENSEESPGCGGLGILKGGIYRIPEHKGLKVPHMGWNSLNIKPASRLLKGIGKNPYVYFVHSFYLKAQNPEDVAATTGHGVMMDAAIERDNCFGCQFHPEKSSDAGLAIIKNFINIAGGRA